MVPGRDAHPPLPRSLAPLPGEGLPGFVLRLAHHLDLTPTQVVRRTGLASEDRGQAPIRHLFMLEANVRAAFARSTRLTEDESDRLTLRSWSSHYPPVADVLGQPGQVLRLRKVITDWMLLSFSRYCPECLAGDGSRIQQLHGGPWKLSWRLPVIFACLEHNRMLVDTCPHCRRPAQAGSWAKSPQLVPLPGLGHLHPARCRNRVSAGPQGAVCGHPLDDLAASPAIQLAPDLADLQRRLQAMLEPGHYPSTAFSRFSDLRVAVALITAARQPPDPSGPPSGAISQLMDEYRRGVHGPWPGRTQPRWGALPTASTASAEVLSLADRLVRLPRTAFRAEIHNLSGRAPRYDASAWSQTWDILRTRCSPLFRHDVEQCCQKIFVPTHISHTGPLVIPVRERGYLPEHIPQRPPGSWLTVLAENGAPPGHLRKPVQFRRVVAVQLVQAAAGCSVDAASELLGIPHSWDRSGPGALMRQNLHPSQNSAHPLLSADIAEAFEALTLHIAREPVNYYQRRQNLAFWHLRHSDWDTITQQLGRMLGQGRRTSSDELLRECASAYIWAAVTGSEWQLAPSFRAPLSAFHRRVGPGTPELRILHHIHHATDHRLRTVLDDRVRALIGSADREPGDYSP
ncbi:TniQ family protein [Kitasatospora sp. NPDC048296]|uniref:TniQ family protein n=1 Tax=Kitasatospora sp. NPDC048296 TaxID=3364048 RepID=UPI00371C3CB6